MILSRTHPEFVIKLFDVEVPEIREGIVEIKEKKGPDGTPLDGVTFHPFHTSKDLIAIVVFGVLPNLMFKIFDPAVTQLVERMGEGIP